MPFPSERILGMNVGTLCDHCGHWQGVRSIKENTQLWLRHILVEGVWGLPSCWYAHFDIKAICGEGSV